MTSVLKSKSQADIPFIDLGSQRARIRNDVLAAMEKVVDHGAYVMGPEVHALEAKLSQHCGAAASMSCASGTDALMLALLAKDIKPGQAVFVPSFTFVATAEVVVLLGATPVFVDVDPVTFNIDPDSLREAVERMALTEYKSAGVIAVDLFGQPADYDAIYQVANEHGLWVIADAAQSYGAKYKGTSVGQLAEITTTSFFPAKPLGCYGEGGAVFLKEQTLAKKIESIRVHGQGATRYEHIHVGFNGRLATIQAAVLLEKLKIFDDELVQRQRVADAYSQGLSDVATVPVLQEGNTSSWAQYTLRIPNRDAVMEKLRAAGIPSGVYYPVPLNQQKAYRSYPVAPKGLPTTKALCGDVISLPMHAYLDKETQDYIIENVRSAIAATS